MSNTSNSLYNICGSQTELINNNNNNNEVQQQFASSPVSPQNDSSSGFVQSDSQMSISTFSQDLQRPEPKKNVLNLPLITGPNGALIEVDKTDYAESEKSAISNKSTEYSRRNRSSEWEILEGLKDGQKCEEKPIKFDGYMLKRRKWPLKGWHKRYFNLENGILSYSKSPTDMMKGKIHGKVDVGLSVISTKRSSKRIDIDAEEFIYHIKVKNKIQFVQWVAMLRHHRLYRQHEIAFGNKIIPEIPVRPVVGFSKSSTPIDSKVAAWILNSNTSIDMNCNKEFNDIQVKLVKLSSLLQSVEMQLGAKPHSIPDVEIASLKKQRRRFLLRRHKKPNNNNSSQTPAKSNNDKNSKKQNAIEIVVSNNDEVNDQNNLPDRKFNKLLSISQHLSSSHPILNEASQQPNSLPESWMIQSYTEAEDNEQSSTSNSLTPNKAVDDFVNLANDINNSFRTLLRTIQQGSLKRGQMNDSVNSNLVYSLRQSLQEALQQNKELKLRLDRIHDASNVGSLSPLASPENLKTTRATSITEDDIDEEMTIIHQPLAQSISHESTSVLSVSEYFDAEENLSACTTSTEDEDEESIATDMSDDGTEYNNALIKSSVDQTTLTTGRRSRLPSPQPDTGDVSLWSLLYKNIGKDLSKISMPVTLNEPLNVLQRLCEELEYSELLDKAALIEDRVQRMLHIAAFAVSAYSSSNFRAGHKPFNPLLGETYECIREDKGFKFISEQVSHHPPISACHADSDTFIFWQDLRIKSKFWGKSMEIIPFGTVHVLLKALKCHYKWNKVTTCVHNIFKGQRWVDQYGEMTITDGDLTCKLIFEKANYWSNKKHEVNGVILNFKGEIIERLFGKWNEALHCGTAPTAKCIWRPGAMPEDFELYYGFSRFAIELNELTPELKKLLPPTDTRLRPDQRLLENGDIQNAEQVKLHLEQLQRERRKKREESGQGEHNPLWFRKELTPHGEETWVYNDRYWQIRNESGFSAIEFEQLW